VDVTALLVAVPPFFQLDNFVGAAVSVAAARRISDAR
jgi:hypothetical protein